jgi:hypothetical protein
VLNHAAKNKRTQERIIGDLASLRMHDNDVAERARAQPSEPDDE